MSKIISDVTEITAGKGWKPFFKEAGGLSIAEFLSSSVAVGTVAYADKVAPHMMQSVTNAIAKSVIEPHLEFFEKSFGALCKLNACKIDTSKPREERAQNIARAGVLFGAAFLPGFAVKVATRRGLNELAGLGDGKPWWNIRAMSHHDWKIAGWDEGIHLGAILAMNTLLPKPTDIMIEHTSSMTQKLFGWSKKQADEASVMLVAHEIPNLLGFTAGVKAIYNERVKETLESALKHPVTTLGNQR